jgi:pimeloyl-ACP methyl ester carboxylesterase
MRQRFMPVLAFAVALSVQAQGQSAPEREAPKIQQEVISLRAQDGAGSWGVLYTPVGKTPQTAVIAMHPEGDYSRQYLLKPLAEAGFAAFGHNNRYAHNDKEGIHEEMLLDIAASVSLLKKRGIQKIVLAGISGGGSLMAFYQVQATTAPPNRLKHTPAGDPPNLNTVELIPADGLLMVIPHLGEGEILKVRIDPSVVVEGDALSVDPTLYMYNPANGFRMPPAVTKYSPEFVRRYRDAQAARMARLDRMARALLDEEKRFKALLEEPGFKNRPVEERLWIERQAHAPRLLHIYRTWADLRYTDLTLDPSDRIVGNNAGTEPWVANYEDAGPWVMTPRAFLSSRSDVSTNAVTRKNLAKVTVPVIIIQGTAQRAIYPEDTKAIFASIASTDKELVWVEGGDVSFRPSGPKAGAGDQLQRAITAAVSWVQKRFP